MEVITAIMVSWTMFVVGAILYTKNFEKKETKLAETVRSRHYGWEILYTTTTRSKKYVKSIHR